MQIKMIQLLLIIWFCGVSFGDTLDDDSHTLVIDPGDDIQSAMDKLNSKYGGGTVLLNPGVYKISSSLMIYSNIMLRGWNSSSLQDTTVEMDPNNLEIDEPMITNNDAYNYSNVGIMNLKLLCNVQPSEQNYPSWCLDCLRNCTDKGKTANDPGCSCVSDCGNGNMRTDATGIAFSGGGTDLASATNENLVIKNLEISHCSMGMASSGWRTVIIDNVKLFNNGMIQAYFHNIYLRRNYNVSITNMESHDSPTGNGINISQSGGVRVYNSYFHNNYWRGLRIYGESGYTIYGINVHNNVCMNNGDYGFLFANIENGFVEDNKAQDNTAGNEHTGHTENVTFSNNNW